MLGPETVALEKLPHFEEKIVEFEELHPPSKKSKSTMPIPNVVECKSQSLGNSTHSFTIVMGLGPRLCISGVTYGHTIIVKEIVKGRYPSKGNL